MKLGRRFHPQGVKDNAKHVAGLLIGMSVLRLSGRRFSKDERGSRWFSTVAANIAANAQPFRWLPFAVLVRSS